MFGIDNGAGYRFDGTSKGGSIFKNLPVQIEDEVNSKNVTNQKKHVMDVLIKITWWIHENAI